MLGYWYRGAAKRSIPLIKREDKFQVSNIFATIQYDLLYFPVTAFVHVQHPR